MRMKWLCQLTWFLVMALLSPSAQARAESAIIGTVADAETKRPSADVVVTATSPGLQGEQVVVTDEQGQYRVPSLPPGVYTLRFEKDGTLERFERSDLLLREGKTLRVNVELLPAVIDDDALMIICGPPVVDVGSTTTGRLVSPAHVVRVALNPPTDPGSTVRSFDALAEVVPGVQRDGHGLSINGATVFENAFVVDGLYASDPVSGLNLHPLSVELLGDVTILTGGYLPEYGRSTGGVIETSTRRGSSHFTGSAFANWAPGFLEGARTSAPSGGSSSTGLKNLGDFGATLSGPLVKDRLLFFAGMVPALSRWEQARVTSSGLRTGFADQRGVQGLGSLTYLFDSDHNVSWSLSTSPTYSEEPGPLTVEPFNGGVLDSNVTTTALHYAGAMLDKKLLLEGRLGWSHQTRSQQSFEGGEDGRVDRYQASTKATYWLLFAGPHLLKAGADAELRLSEQPSRSTSQLVGGFVQDSWSMTEWLTLNAGVRYDVWSLSAGEGRAERVTSNPLSPRLGVVVDPWANGRTKLFAHYARYHAPVLFRTQGNASVPDLVLPGSTELVAGAEAEVPSLIRLGATWTHRSLDPVREELPKRTSDAVSVFLSRLFMNDWLVAEVSYTWSRVRGNTLLPVIATARPSALSDVEPSASRDDGAALRVPYDRPHFIKAFGAREFRLSRRVNASVGLSYRGSSGTPVTPLTSGSGQRTPWVHSLDSTLRVGYWPDKRHREEISLTLNVFNLLNAQEVTRVGEVSAGEVAPVEYQAPRQVRLGARYTF